MGKLRVARGKNIEASPLRSAAQAGLRYAACALLLVGFAVAHAGTSAPPPAGPAALGATATPPKVASTVNPEYTQEARSERITGRCVLAATIDAAGIPQNITVVTSVADGVSSKRRAAAATLDTQAIKALQQYRFHPAMKDGQPVAAKIKVAVNFQLF